MLSGGADAVISGSNSSNEVMAHPRSRRTVFAICISLFCLTWLVFGQTCRFNFVNYDDESYVTGNPVVRQGITLNGIIYAFTGTHSDNWHPLTTLSHMLDCQFFGVNAGAHHFINVLLHSICVVMLFLVWRNMTGWLWRSAFVAAVFAIHPLRAESVVWVSERKDVLSAIFFIAMVAAYVRYARQPSATRYLLTAVIFGFGLMSKPMLVTAPLVLLVLDYWPLNRFKPQLFDNKRLLLEKIPFLVLSAADCVLTLWAQKKAVIAGEHLSIVTRLGNAAVSCAIYVWQTIWPEKLAVFYPYPEHGWPTWAVIGAMAMLIMFSGAAILLRQKRPYLFTGWAWYLIMLVPVIGFVQVGEQAHADRYTYLPQIGLCIIVTGIAGDLARSVWQQRTFAVSAAVTVAILAWQGAIQASYWRDSESLWRRAIAVTGDFHAYHGLGLYSLSEGRLPEAIELFETSLRLKPNNADANFNLGVALERSGNLEEAIPHLAKAAVARPNFPEAYYRLGNDLLALGSPLVEVIKQYQQALTLRPHYPEAHYNLGTVLVQQHDTDQAIIEYQRAIEDNPRYPEAHYALGNAFLQKGRVDDAIANYRHALQSKPDYPDVENNLAAVLMLKGEVRQAIDQWRKLIQQHDSSSQAINNLAWVLATYPDDGLRDGREAVRLAARARQLSHGKDASILRTLAAAYAESGQFDQAVTTAEQAREIAAVQGNPTLADILASDVAAYRAHTATRTAPRMAE